jgi:RNA polymerase sigma-70 factor (ECF subfamily)
MSDIPQHEFTRILKAARTGKRDALDQLFPLVYDELRQLSLSQMRKQKFDHTLQPTALVHEVYLRVVDQATVDLNDRTHFFALSAKIMRQVLVDHARRKDAAKRGGNWLKVTLQKAASPAEDQEVAGIDVIDLDDALKELAEMDPRKAQVVEMRFFAGMTLQEVGEALEVSHGTVESDWFMARAWSRNKLEAD